MLPPQVIVLRLCLSASLGLVVGIDRSRFEEPAGLRTHALVASGACLFMIVSAFGFADIIGVPGVALDPSRIAAQVVTGIGFLGAGTIIVQRELVRGLTTAASVWAVAAVGLAVGGGLYLAAASSTVVILVILVLVKHVEPLLHPFHGESINIVLDSSSTSLQSVRSALDNIGVQIERLIIQPNQLAVHEDRVELVIKRAARQDDIAVVDALGALPGILYIETPVFRRGEVPQERQSNGGSKQT